MLEKKRQMVTVALACISSSAMGLPTMSLRPSTTVFFFFSSRRRHTRCSRDWSSDVCSSDLPGGGGAALLLARAAAPEQASRVGDQTGGRVFLFLRSEERRVGKECRSRWS